jgi:hypothetical protein
MESAKISYNNKINAISSYFGVSFNAAKYMYNRRQRGFPYKHETDMLFLEWSIQLQNALVKADKISGFNWDELNFDNDINILNANNIKVKDQHLKIHINKINKSAYNFNEKNMNGESNEKNMNGESNEKNMNGTSNEKNMNGTSNEKNMNEGWTVVTNNKDQMIRRQILKQIGFLPKFKFKRVPYT